MRVFQVDGAWSMDHLRLGQRPEPQAGVGQIRLAMRAAALNYRDLLVPHRGYGQRMQNLPLIMLSDGVGVVDQVGAGARGASVGERWCPMLFQGWQAGAPDAQKLSRGLGCETDGTAAEWLLTDPLSAAPVPAYLSDVEAACLPTAGLTAWRALVTDGNVKPGDVVVVQGTGAVGLTQMVAWVLLNGAVSFFIPMMMGFDGSNNRPYTAIGAVLVEMGVMKKEDATWPAIRDWLKRNPQQARDVMRRNERYIFFKDTRTSAPIGAEGVVLTAQRSMAIDPTITPYGTPIWIDTKRPVARKPGATEPYRRLMISQDTGAAIKGPARGDVYFGSGTQAADWAGRMVGDGRAIVLVPNKN